MTTDTNRQAPPPGDEVETTAGELARRCGHCHAAIPGEFFLLGAAVLCPTCAGGIQQGRRGRDRLRRAVLFGMLAGAVLASLWYLATVATSRPLAGVAVLTGVGIGLAVHRGAGRRGGLRYQIVAALLVYVAFVARYVPPVFGGIAQAIKQQQASASVSSRSAVDTAAGPSTPPASASEPTPERAARTSGFATLRAYFVFTAIAWGLVLASPFLPGSLGVLSLLCLALGMLTAAGLNRRIHLHGPFPGA